MGRSIERPYVTDGFALYPKDHSIFGTLTEMSMRGERAAWLDADEHQLDAVGQECLAIDTACQALECLGKRPCGMDREKALALK